MAKHGRSSTTTDMLLPSEGLAFDPEAFDQLLRNNGVVLQHYASMMCPIGIDDRFDIRSHGNHECDNGFMYRFMGDVTVRFSDNVSDPVFEDIGLVDGSTALITLPHTYDDSDKPITLSSQDRFFMRDVQAYSVHKQMFSANQSGVERLEYRAESVEFLVDSSGHDYKEGKDFVLHNGNIKWLPNGARPGYDPVLEKGVVCSVRYSFRSYWYVKRLLHEIRVARVVDPVTGDVKFVRLPWAAMLQRELSYRNKANEPDKPQDGRSQPLPESGSFGPR